MSFSSLEKKSTAIVSLILALRLLGLFMLLPIFSIYAMEYTNSNAFLAGVAIGIYSLAQAIMQIPLAYLSDRIGRKKGCYSRTTCFYSWELNLLHSKGY